jgi:hypothetical protein
MALTQDFLQNASIQSLKPRFHPSSKFSWPQAKISF